MQIFQGEHVPGSIEREEQAQNALAQHQQRVDAGLWRGPGRPAWKDPAQGGPEGSKLSRVGDQPGPQRRHQCLGERSVDPAARRGPAGEHETAAGLGVPGQIGQQRRLADPRFAGHQHCVAAADSGLVEEPVEQPTSRCRGRPKAPWRAVGRTRRHQQRRFRLDVGATEDWGRPAIVGRPARRALGHRRDEVVAPAVQGLDHALSLAVVADRSPGLLDPAGHGCLADEPSAPDLVHQLFLADDPLAVIDQVDQDVERLGFQRDPLTVSAQLEQGEVELEFGEPEAHVPISASPRR